MEHLGTWRSETNTLYMIVNDYHHTFAVYTISLILGIEVLPMDTFTLRWWSTNIYGC